MGIVGGWAGRFLKGEKRRTPGPEMGNSRAGSEP
jgi:hypothetical protein